MDYMTERCELCGYNFGAFGRVHRCVPVLVKSSPKDIGPTSQEKACVTAGTYKYRDPEKRRAQVRAAVARHRERKHATEKR